MCTHVLTEGQRTWSRIRHAFKNNIWQIPASLTDCLLMKEARDYSKWHWLSKCQAVISALSFFFFKFCLLSVVGRTVLSVWCSLSCVSQGLWGKELMQLRSVKWVSCKLTNSWTVSVSNKTQMKPLKVCMNFISDKKKGEIHIRMRVGTNHSGGLILLPSLTI